MCAHCKNNARGGRSVLHGAKRHLVREIAERKIADLDSATILEMVGDDRVSLDAAIESAERMLRKQLSKKPLAVLWQMAEDL